MFQTRRIRPVGRTGLVSSLSRPYSTPTTTPKRSPGCSPGRKADEHPGTLRPTRHKIAVLRQAVYQRFLTHEAAGELPTSNRFILYELRQHQPAALFGWKSRSRGRRPARSMTGAPSRSRPC